VDLSFILRAFAKGADGVLIGGCWLGECHYVTEGNYDALGNVALCKKLLAHLGVSPERLRIEWIAASEGSRFAEVVNDFVKQQKALGPIGEGEGLEASVLARRLRAALGLVPYLKLVERERLRPLKKSESIYREHFASDEVNRIFQELIVERLDLSQILQLLAERPLSTGEICEQLGMTASVVSRHLTGAARQGWVQWDVEQRRFALAQHEQQG
jgi:DNA-binding transcriptional ArsR family regulator